MIVRVSVVLRRTVCGGIDCRFDNLSGSHHQSQLPLGLSLHSDDDFRSFCRNVSPSQDYTHPDDHNLPPYDMTSGFKPFTV